MRTLGALQCGLCQILICGFAASQIPSASAGHSHQRTLATKHIILYAPHSPVTGMACATCEPPSSIECMMLGDVTRICVVNQCIILCSLHRLASPWQHSHATDVHTWAWGAVSQ